jgi:hypothetical protein
MPLPAQPRSDVRGWGLLHAWPPGCMSCRLHIYIGQRIHVQSGSAESVHGSDSCTYRSCASMGQLVQDAEYGGIWAIGQELQQCCSAGGTEFSTSSCRRKLPALGS